MLRAEKLTLIEKKGGISINERDRGSIKEEKN